MKIGSWGSVIVFKVSDNQIRTFQDLKLTVSGRWAKHTPVYGRPVMEFQGSENDTASMTIELDASLGVKPEKIIRSINTAVRNGQVNPLIVGGKKIGHGSFAITSTTTAYEVIIKKGKIYRAKIDLNFSEG